MKQYTTLRYERRERNYLCLVSSEPAHLRRHTEDSDKRTWRHHKAKNGGDCIKEVFPKRVKFRAGIECVCMVCRRVETPVAGVISVWEHSTQLSLSVVCPMDHFELDKTHASTNTRRVYPG